MFRCGRAGPIRRRSLIETGSISLPTMGASIASRRRKAGSSGGSAALLRSRNILGNQRLISTWPIRGGPVLLDGTIYFTAGIWPFMGIFIHAVDAQTGKVVWTNSGDSCPYVIQPHNSPAFGGFVPRGHSGSDPQRAGGSRRAYAAGVL